MGSPRSLGPLPWGDPLPVDYFGSLTATVQPISNTFVSTTVGMYILVAYFQYFLLPDLGLIGQWVIRPFQISILKFQFLIFDIKFKISNLIF